jgi:hypothetical protein
LIFSKNWTVALSGTAKQFQAHDFAQGFGKTSCLKTFAVGLLVGINLNFERLSITLHMDQQYGRGRPSITRADIRTG